MLRTSISALLFSVLAISAAEAQVYVLELRDQDSIRPYRKYVLERGGEYVLAGEVVLGLNDKNGNISWSTGATLRVILLDPRTPSPAPYKVARGQRAGVSRSRVAEFKGSEVADVRYLTRDHDLASLAREYELRKQELEDLEAAQKKLDRGSDEADRWHDRLRLHTARLQRWLQQVGFDDVAQKMERDLKRLRRRGYEMPEIVSIEVPETLKAAAEALLGDPDAFAIRESPHCRITYLKSAIEEPDVDPLLIYAEELIDQVRFDFIYVYQDQDETYEDWIPNEVFKEYYFGPVELEPHKEIWERYYGKNWGPHVARLIENKGTRTTRAMDRPYLDYWKTKELDYYDVVSHGLGHALADLHFNKWRRDEPIAWLTEAFANYLPLENLGRSNTFCRAFRETRYAGEKSEGGGEAHAGYEAIHRAALEKNTPIDTLSTKELAQMEPSEVAKGVSFFIYLVDEQGLAGQLFLRAGCDAASRHRSSFLETWRAEAAELFDIPEGKDPLAELDQRWLEWVQLKLGEE